MADLDTADGRGLLEHLTLSIQGGAYWQALVLLLRERRVTLVTEYRAKRPQPKRTKDSHTRFPAALHLAAVYCMMRGHRQRVAAVAPSCAKPQPRRRRSSVPEK